MSKLTWKQFLAIWSDQFGITPEEASNILEKNWLDKNYTAYSGNIWKDPDNKKAFKNYVQYVYSYMRDYDIKWEAALLELFADKDKTSLQTLTYMNVPHHTWKPRTFAKLIGQWRIEFIEKGWIGEDFMWDKPMIKRAKLVEKKLSKSGLLKKKKKKNKK